MTTVVVQGCYLPNCPRATLLDAGNRDYRTVLITDATSQVTQARLDDLRLIGVNLVTADQVGSALATSGAAPITDDRNSPPASIPASRHQPLPH